MRHFVDDDFDPIEDYEGHCCGPNWKSDDDDYEGHCCGPNWKSDDDDYESTIKHFQD